MITAAHAKVHTIISVGSISGNIITIVAVFVPKNKNTVLVTKVILQKEVYLENHEAPS